MNVSDLRRALEDLGSLLGERGLSYDLVLIKGATLLLRGLVPRAITRDVDVMAEFVDGRLVAIDRMPEPLAKAVRDVAGIHGLAEDWLNIGPATLMGLGLPDGFEDRLEPEEFGALTVRHAGRTDLIALKLYVAVDGWPSTLTRHMGDLRELRPDDSELLQAARWTRTHDISPACRDNLVATLAFLGVEDVDERIP